MCGIVGYIGTKQAEPILINGLYKLEYRGYDSAGIATLEDSGIKCVKQKGRVKNLDDMPETKTLLGNIGIAHTRWATHGKPSDINSHPHIDNANHIAVVHNGIIENCETLRDFLINNGYKFLSETDTEVIPNLIDFHFKELKQNGNDDEINFLYAVRDTVKMLKGSYAIEIISDYTPEKIIVARKSSPLVIGRGEGENYIGSDISPILGFTNKFYMLNDDEIAVLTKDNIVFFDNDLEKLDKDLTEIEISAEAAEKGGYEDYMLKEIYEQPTAIQETIGRHISKGKKCQVDELSFTKEDLNNINKIYLVACGTAMHAGLVSRPMFENLCKIQTEVDVASEFRYRDPLVDEHTLCIFISQSGETADTIAALKLAREKGAKTIAISNVIESSITREADYTLYTHAGPEIAVASTKAYTAQVSLLIVLALYFAETLEIESSQIEEIKEELLDIPNKVEKALKCRDSVHEFAKKVKDDEDMFFIGRGVDYAAVMEGCLKLKEISYIHSEAFASGELKHGPIALIEDGTLVVTILTDSKLAEKTISNVQETKARGSRTFAVTNLDLGNADFDFMVKIPEVNKFISPILSIIPLQLFAYYISKEKGLDVDKPRNLAKSVTVE
jgi:glucosamine--fructose-6-phosphate aminotransferase (isomerizing)